MVDNRIKVLLVNRSQLLRESLVNLIQFQDDIDDIEVVGEVFDLVELLLMVGRTQADVVVMAMQDSDEEPGICSHLLTEYPQLLVLVLSSERESAFLYRQITSKEYVSEVSKGGILKAIRRVKDEC